MVLTERLVRNLDLITMTTLERVVGLWGWALLAHRRPLAILNSVYVEMRAHRGARGFAPSSSAREELWALRCVGPT
eukprot:2043254-Lingulodinium_polyedra.AAC.1